MEMKDYVYDALKILIRISENAQDRFKWHYRHTSSYSWIKEYCTVRATTARAGGHTTAISRLIDENDMKLGVIFGSHTMQKAYPYRDKLVFSATVNDYKHSLLGKDLKDLDGIVIDTAYFLSQTKRDEISKYIAECLAPSLFSEDGERKFFLILLQ